MSAPCDTCGGPGWIAAEAAPDGFVVERCDECGLYECDQEAALSYARAIGGGTVEVVVTPHPAEPIGGRP